jgi:excinuclease UvrABC nuclease subunit
MNARLTEKLKKLPGEPGVYFHKAKTGEVIYVGKAAVLKNRVRQYFQESRLRDAKTDALVAEIYDTDWITTESEIDALFLESEMIKRYKPRFNILLQDDKSQRKKHIRTSALRDNRLMMVLTTSAHTTTALQSKKRFAIYAKSSHTLPMLLCQIVCVCSIILVYAPASRSKRSRVTTTN